MALITVIGASGRQGLAQVRQALAAGYDVRAISRQADPFAGANIDGVERVEVRPMDLYDPATYRAALEGTDYIFYTHPLQARADRAVLVGDVGKAAAELGVKRVVWNTSSWIPDKPGDAFTYAGNTAGINALWRSGAPGTVFGSVLFMDNLLTNWARPFIVNEGRYVYPHNPALEANWISLDDVARFMLASLERPDMEGAWLNIGGPERLVGKQVTQCLSEALGKEIKYDPCTPAEFGRYLVEAAGDTKYTAALATSSGAPFRRIRVRSIIAARSSGEPLSRYSRTSAVSIAPGWIPLTRMRGPRSAAIDFVT